MQRLTRRESWLARSELSAVAGVPQRVKLCGRRRYQRHITIKASNGAAWFEGVLRCRTRLCPVCWVARRATAAREIGFVVDKRTELTRAQPLLATMTIRHGADDPVAICRAVRRCWQKFLAGRSWERFRERTGVQFVAAEEITRGQNGWHPHMHVILLPTEEPRLVSAETGLTLSGAASFVVLAAAEDDRKRRDGAALLRTDGFASEHADWWHERWTSIVAREMGAQHVPNRDHGIDLRPSCSTEYLTKLGMELTDPGGRKGRAALALLLDGEQELYVELQNSRHRCKDISFSRGLAELRKTMPQGAEAVDVLTLRGSEYERLLQRGGEVARALLPADRARLTEDEFAKLVNEPLIDVLEGATAGEAEARVRAEKWIGPIDGGTYDDTEEPRQDTRSPSRARARERSHALAH